MPYSLNLENLIKKVNDLPSLPIVTMQVMKLTDDPKTSILDLANTILQDQALTAKILRLANSAFYGFARSISTITDAIVILGFKSIRDLVLAASVYDVANKELKGYALAKGELWKQSIISAMLARKIAKKIKYHSTDEAFVAGLLHDIGKVVINLYVNEAYKEILAKVENEKIPFLVAEKEILGFDHAEVGAYVARKWNLPESLVNTIAFHHNPSEAPGDKQQCAIVHISDAICMTIGVGLGADGLLYQFDEGALKELHLKGRDIEDIISEVSDELVDINTLTDL